MRTKQKRSSTPWRTSDRRPSISTQPGYTISSNSSSWTCRDRTFFDPKHPVPKDTDLKTVAAWYKNRLDINLRQLPAWHKIRELECVANTVKHGEGPSATKLRKIRPDLFEHPVTRTILPKSSWNAVQEDPLELRSPLAGDLYITKEQFAEFAGTTEKFLREIVDYFEKHADEYYPRE